MRVFSRFRSRKPPSLKLPTSKLPTSKLPVWKRILFIVVSNVLALGTLAIIGEVVCRLWTPQLDYEVRAESEMTILQFSDDPYLGFELRPGADDHNSHGTRGPEIAVGRGEGVWRIAVIGDSIPYGLGVRDEQAFPRLVEAKLNGEGKGRVEVLNFGVPGYSSYQEYMMLRTRALQFNPHLVVMVFSTSAVETSPVVLNVGGDMCLFRNQFEGVGLLNNRLHWAVFRHSHLYRLLYKNAVLTFVAAGSEFTEVYVDPEVSWGNVLRSAKLCEQKGVTMLVLLSPQLQPHYRPPPEVEAQMTDATEMLVDLDVYEFYNRAFDKVRALAAESGLQVLDLGPLYEKHQSEMKLIDIDHDHLGPRGHEFAAQWLFEELRKCRPQVK